MEVIIKRMDDTGMHNVGIHLSEKKVQVLDTPQVSTVLRSNLMRLYFPVDLTGNLIMIEKLVSGGT